MLYRDFYSREAVEVARDLLGCYLVRKTGDGELVGKIVETEAYCGEDDSACHAYVGKTERNETMYGEPGRTYVYLIYGIHELLNFVVAEKGVPEAVLIRAVEPVEGIEEMEENRGRENDLTNGPGKLTEAFNISLEDNGLDVTKRDSSIIVRERDCVGETVCSERIGVDEDSDLRFFIRGNKFVSTY